MTAVAVNPSMSRSARAEIACAGGVGRVLGTLAAIGFVAFYVGMFVAMDRAFGSGPGARSDCTRISVAAVVEDLERHHVDKGRYPTTAEGLRVLNAPSIGGDDELALKDCFGHYLQYASPGAHNEAKFDVWSAGADGVLGTDDDIVSWTEE